jgi:hypothetical protein
VTLYAASSVGGAANCGDAADPCTLTTALNDAGTQDAGDTVTIQLASGSYPAATVSAGSESSLTLAGSGGVTISATSGAALTLDASSVDVTLTQLTIEGGAPDVELTAAARLTITDSALIGGAGDGVDATSGALSIEDSTIAANSGTGVTDSDSAPVAVYGSTIAHNRSGGIAVAAGSVDLGADLLAANGAHDCSGTITDQGYNDSDDGTCTPIEPTSHVADPQLSVDAPAANGGPTESARLVSTSDADVAVPAGQIVGSEAAPFCSGTDQRGIARTQGPATQCDAGAFQYAPPVVTSLSPRSALELGLPVTLNGYGFANLTGAAFGSTAVTIASHTDTSLTLAVPGALGLGSEPITLSNPDGSAQVPFAAVAPPAIGTWLMAPGELRVPYSAALPTNGGAGPFSFALTSGALPAGLSLSASGVVSGTPVKAGGSAFAVTVTDANAISSAPLNVSLVIATPVISLTPTRVKVVGGAIPVSVTCSAAPCTGHLVLDESVTVTKHHKKQLKSVALAATIYRLSAGQGGTFDLTLTPTGHRVLSRRALKKAKKHPLHEMLQATVAGGTTEAAAVAFSWRGGAGVGHVTASRRQAGARHRSNARALRARH